MKPPPRKRVRKCQELAPVSDKRKMLESEWPLKDKRKLLKTLTELHKEAPGELLDPHRVKERMPSRTVEEIKSVLDSLKEKVIVFAKSRYQAERREERRSRKPLEHWMHWASALSAAGGDDEVLTYAFSQALTVSSSEPCPTKEKVSQLYSPARPLPTGKHHASNASPQLSQSPSESHSAPVEPPVTKDMETPTPSQDTNASAQTSAVSGPTSKPPVRRRTAADNLSFERIYQYLSVLHEPSQHVKLTAMESAVVLDLLMSLPEELQMLDCEPLVHHITQTYERLSSSAESVTTTDKEVKQSTRPPPPANQPPLTGPTHLQTPPIGPPDPPTPPTELLHPSGPTSYQPSAVTLTVHQPPISGPTVHQPPTTAPKVQQPSTTTPTHTEGVNCSQSTTDVRKPAPLNPFLIPVSLLTRKEQPHQT